MIFSSMAMLPANQKPDLKIPVNWHGIPLVRWISPFCMKIITCQSKGFRYFKRWDIVTLHWRHNDHGGISNHQPHGCLLNRLFRRRSKKTSKLRVTGLCAGKSPGPVNSPHKGPVTRKMVPFDSIMKIMWATEIFLVAYFCVTDISDLAKFQVDTLNPVHIP